MPFPAPSAGIYRFRSGIRKFRPELTTKPQPTPIYRRLQNIPSGRKEFPQTDFSDFFRLRYTVAYVCTPAG
jgi:hypothetical protein